MAEKKKKRKKTKPTRRKVNKPNPSSINTRRRGGDTGDGQWHSNYPDAHGWYHSPHK